MSGIEVIGVVLGALPLLIAGLEHYAAGADTVKRAFRAGHEFRVLKQKLDDENLLFRNTITILLEESVNVEMQGQLMDIGGVLWADPAVQDALQLRLCDSYDSYVSHVQDMRFSLENFRTRLGITAQDQVPFEINKYSFRQAYNQLRFAMKREKYLDLIAEIAKANTFLEKLSSQSKALQSIRSTKRTPDFEQVRSAAANIYESLKRGLQISCTAVHRASICLETHALDEQETGVVRHSRTAEDKSFRIVLHHDALARDPVPSWWMQETEVRLIDVIPVQSKAGVIDATSGESSKSGKKRVGFQHVPIMPDTAAGPATAIASQVQEIRDLCHSISTLGNGQCGACLGYMQCVSTGRRHGLYCPAQGLLDKSSFAINTLSSLLDQKAPTYCKISGLHARQLAVALATGLLRLYSTPWLQCTWNKSNVTVIRQKGKMLAECPFISRDILAVGGQPSRHKSSQGLAALVIKDQNLFTLGIILIELCMKCSIDALHLPAELEPDGTKHELSDFHTAARLLKDNTISDEYGSRWSDVVERCIYCSLDCPRKTLEDGQFRRAYHGGVVAKLEEEYRQFLTLG